MRSDHDAAREGTTIAAATPADVQLQTRSGQTGKGRVLFVTSSFPRWVGDSTTPFVLHLAQDLQQMGWAVHVVAPHAPGAQTRERLEGIEVERFRYLWPESAQTVCYSGGALINLRRNRWNYLKVPALVASEFSKVLVRLAGRSFDLVHSHWIIPQGFVAGVASRITNVPHVATVHGGDIYALRGPVTTRFKKAAFGLADVVTVNSSATCDAVRAAVPNLRKLVRIPIGASGPARDFAEEAGDIRVRFRNGDGPLLVFVGRLVEEKGVDDLLQAIRILAQTRPNTTALIIGEGQERRELEALAVQLGVADRVTFTGWVDPARIHAHMAAGDVFIGPSKRSRDGWQEGQGLTFVEAMLAGTPVIATDCGGIHDVVRNEHTGLIVRERAPAEIVGAIERLTDDHELADRLRASALAFAADGFTRSASARRFSEIYADLIASHPDRRRPMLGPS